MAEIPMIYITGDTHGNDEHDAEKLSKGSMKELGITPPTANDVVIVCGDFGFPALTEEGMEKYKALKTYKYWINWMSHYPCEILFVDGNHECHEFWSGQPTVMHYGGLMHQHPEAPNVYHMMRGEIYEIQGHTILAFGGAKSHGCEDHIEGMTWWPSEQPSSAEYTNALKNLEKYNHTVDYIITHTMPISLIEERVENTETKKEKEHWESFKDTTSEYLDSFYNDDKGYDGSKGVNFKHWFCGHFHMDEEFAPKITGHFKKYSLIEAANKEEGL